MKTALVSLITIDYLTNILVPESWCSFSPISFKYLHQIAHINQKKNEAFQSFIQFLYKRELWYVLTAGKYLNLLLLQPSSPSSQGPGTATTPDTYIRS